jgi:hypothetical protein
MDVEEAWEQVQSARLDHLPRGALTLTRDAQGLIAQ